MPRQRQVNSLGSGVVISPYGYVVTNAHVVKRASEIKVQFADGSVYGAKVVVADSSTDLAVIKLGDPAGEPGVVKTKKPFPYMQLGRSDDIMVGETVIAVGNPLGFANSVTTGVVSATDRKLEFQQGVTYTGLIQTDAPINPGNSGGPLLNIKGELIGINTAIRADAQNIGFAIGIDMLAKKLPELLDIENLARVEFGLRAAQSHTDKGASIYVSSVREKSPGDRAGVKAGDRILSVNGKKIAQVSDFVFEMLEARVPGKIRLEYDRAGRRSEANVDVKLKPAPDGDALARSMMGLQLREITPRMARSMRLFTVRGLLVVGVEEGSPADKLGVQLKDILFEVGGVYISKLETLGLILEKLSEGQVMRIGILRRNTAAVVPIRLRGRSAGASKKEVGT
jgi:serine protease Do